MDPLAFYYLADAGERLGTTVARQALLDYDTLRGDTDARRRNAQAVRLAELSLKLNDPPVAAAYFLRAADNGDPTLLARAADAQLRAGDTNAARATVAKALGERIPTTSSRSRPSTSLRSGSR